MKNIHVLPTDKPSRLVIDTIENKLYYQPILHNKTVNVLTQNIYITSDEEIKEGDYVTNGKYVSQAINEWWTKFYIGNPKLKSDYWKIILTTDQDLIKDGVQEISDEFLEWFVAHPSCEKVEIINYNPFTDNKFSIIIPKEEHCDNCNNDICCCIIREEPKQERSYSEEDLREAFKQSRQAFIFEKDMPCVYDNFDEWFEQYKKK